MITPSPFKRCCACKEFLPATAEYFHRAGNRKDGLTPRCKICTKKYQQENHPKMVEAAYRWRDANPGEFQDAQKNWREKNAEKLINYSRNYRLAHLEESRQSSLNWKAANPDKGRQYGKKWAKNNPVKHAAKGHLRRVRKMGNGGSYTAEEWEALCASYDYLCLRCKEQKPLTVDHVVPVSKGGSNSIENLQPLCKECNSHKGQGATDYR